MLPLPKLRYVTARIIDYHCEQGIHPTAHLHAHHCTTTSENRTLPRFDRLGLRGSHKTCQKYHQFLMYRNH